MKEKAIKIFDFIIYWSVILIPFFMAIAPAPMNVFFGLLVFSFLAKKIILGKKFYVVSQVSFPYLVFFMLSAFSLINSINYQDSLRGLSRLIQNGILILIISDQVKDKKHLQKVIFSMILGASLLSVDALWQIISGKDFIRGNLPVINIGIKRATGSFPDANVLGIYLSAIAPLPVGLTFFYFKKHKKVIMALISSLILLGLMLTYSRPTLLAIYIVLIFFGIVNKNRILILSLIAFIFFAPFIMPRSIKDWAKEVDYNPLRFMCNDDRIAIYRNSWHMINDHPIIGVGVNTFMKNYRKYKESPEYRNIITSDFVYAHNNCLHMAGEIGLLGLGAFLWFLYRVFTVSWHIFKEKKDNYLKVSSLSIIACLIAFLVNGLTESSLYYSRVALIFWYLIGFSLSLKNIRA
jgi:O-antigen ligase